MGRSLQAVRLAKDPGSLEHRDVLEIEFKKHPLTILFRLPWTVCLLYHYFITMDGRKESYHLFSTYCVPSALWASPHLTFTLVV